MKGFGSAALLLLLVACVYTESNECPQICTAEYSPVCASDGVTYGNMCAFQSAACKKYITLERLGECPASAGEKRQAPCPGCTMEWNPVCGSDGNTYGNNCSLSSAACSSGTSITFVHNGGC